MPIRPDAIAAAVLEAVGGRLNVVANSTCMTRLRITVADPTLVRLAAFHDIDGVIGTVERGVNGIEVVFRPRIIGLVFKEFSSLTGLEAGIEPLIGSRRPSTRLNVHIAPGNKQGASSDKPAPEPTGVDDTAFLDSLATLLEKDKDR